MLRGPGDMEAIRFAARVAADPAHAVGLWRAVSGGKAAGCLSAMPVPEILHAAGVLPVRLAGAGISRTFRSCVDAWIVDPGAHPIPAITEGMPRFEFPPEPFVDGAAALDLLESLASWAGALSGRPASEGALWNSIRAFRERENLLRLLREREPGGGDPRSAGGTAYLVRAGDFLPPESHSRLLAIVLGVSDTEGTAFPEGERGDPLLALSLRLKKTVGSAETLIPCNRPDRKKTVDRDSPGR